MSQPVVIDGHSLTLDQVLAVAHHHVPVEISSTAIAAVQAARLYVEKLITEKRVVYGITTGFGNFKHVTIKPDQVAQLQVNLVRSHAVGVGQPLSEPEVRAMMLIRANSLASGYSGVRPELIDQLLVFLNKNVVPYVPSQGSVGASGDLAPLAHIALTLMGEGEVLVDDQRRPTGPELQRLGLTPIQYQAKEGLAFTNGTTFMTSLLSLSLVRAQNLMKIADIAGAVTLESLRGAVNPMDERVANIRPHPGLMATAKNIRALTKGSEVIAPRDGWKRVQDSYTLRCIPQVHGACRDAIQYVTGVLKRELNSVTDNPLIFAKDDWVTSAGHFHGEPVAIPADVLGIAVAELGNMSERRTAKLVDPSTSEGLPAFLIPKEQAGLSSGFMIPQYTAAALVSENKVLAHPASVDSIPTSANQEDHVSMGSVAVRKLRDIVGNVENVLAIELLTAAQAISLQDLKGLGAGTAAAYKLIRQHVPELQEDRVMYTDMEKAVALVRDGSLTAAVEVATGVLH